MGSYENIVKIEEIRIKVNEGNLLSAQKVLDTMEIRKIKNISDLNLFAEVCFGNERYEEAADLYLKIYEKVNSRKSLFNLIEVFIKLNKVEEAEGYLSQYQKIAPRDFYQYIFRYKIDKIKGESFEHLIELLEELKRTEYTEKWAYELAKLYYKAGMEKECIRECSDIELWFGEGTYVEKAKILKSYYAGDTDKDKFMEEIKRRAEGIYDQNEAKLKSASSEEATREYEKEYKDTDQKESPKDMEGDLYLHAKFMVQEDGQDFEDELKNDVRNLFLHEEDAIYEDSESLYHGQYSNAEDITDYNNPSESDMSTKPLTVEQEQNYMDDIFDSSQQGEMDEEDHRLMQMAEYYQINMNEIFGDFLHIDSIKRQLVKNLDYILQDYSSPRTLFITGPEGSGKTTLAKGMALFFYYTGILKSSKVAKIKADKLNHVDIHSKRDTLKDCCLVIENAGDLKKKTLDNLLEFIQSMNGDIVVIFEDNKTNLNKLFKENPIVSLDNQINLT